MSDENTPLLASTERLVAYLDGELPESATRELEQALANEPATRTEIEKLNRAWELLDLLPRPNASDELTSRTLTAIHAASTNEGETAAATAWFGRKTLIAAGLLVVALIGFGIGRRTARPPVDPLLDDLPVIENFDLLSEVGEVQFLRELQAKGGLNGRPSQESR